MADPVTATDALLGLPVIVWSGIVAAGMTLLGTLGAVVATNWGNTKRLKLQLQHDTTEKAKKRLATLRRELYLKAVDANVRGLAYFGTLPQVDLTKPDADAPLRNVLAIGAQLQLVVSQETAQLISNLISAYGELQLRLIAKVLPIHKARIGINICNEHYENMQVEIKRVLAAMTNLNESGQPDPARFAQINQSFEWASGRAQELATERAGYWDQVNALQRQYLRDLLPELKRLGEMQIHVLVELRRELDVGGDIDVFQRMMREQMERAERAVDEFDSAVFGAGSASGAR
ncbi:MAG: hypothetical protein WD793_11050 [Steroidobacteraceae bacterium]